MDFLITLISFLVLMSIGYFFGSRAEKNHYRSIHERELSLVFLPAVANKKMLDPTKSVESAVMVHGSAVISVDYFKRFFAGLRNLIGGNVVSYETLIDRARREAMLRMKEMAGDADIILNLRLQTSNIGASMGKKGGVACLEVIAYGTAITYRKS
ncbi:YbjQ family protein [Desulfococcaceae bacterium OttesenSCG-928-F15]|nr:YbjQ family protein [Desulfococcaceae bacterium OttesenSCG-928-F15]